MEAVDYDSTSSDGFRPIDILMVWLLAAQLLTDPDAASLVNLARLHHPSRSPLAPSRPAPSPLPSVSGKGVDLPPYFGSGTPCLVSHPQLRRKNDLFCTTSSTATFSA